MTNANIRVRFAPSPTGYLHVGGARTALFNWLFARKGGGTFLLRIEDTDRERSSDENTRVILDGLTWLGLDWDEDPVFQGAGIKRHRDLADQLVREGKAYEEEGAVWFRMPENEISWDDAVYKRIRFQGSDIKDWVILRSDRTPTYNFTVVADDVHMRITHVMRGDDHISNTPKQIAVYEALGHDPPIFAHVPMIHGIDGKKLSKRHGATAIRDYRTLGILASAMRNFLALLGWSAGDDRELFFETDELIRAFSLTGIQKKSAIFDPAKLEWMNGQHIGRTSAEDLFPLIEPELERIGLDLSAFERERLMEATTVQRERARTTLELARRVAVRLDSRFIKHGDGKAAKLIAKDPEGFRTALEAAHQLLESVDDREWQPEPLEQRLRGLAETLGVGPGNVFQPIRVALTGETVSEPVNILLHVVGKESSLARITSALQKIQ